MMLRNGCRALLFLTLVAGCTPTPQIARPEAFSPSKLRLHPTFTQVKDWTGDNKPDGVEVVVELLDSFGEPTRGSGTLLFELWSFRKYDPNPLGNRACEPWKGELLTREQQEAHWSQALRSYTFQLAMPLVNPTKEYVLTASFESIGGADMPAGARLYDRLVIEPPPEKRAADRNVKKSTGKR